MFTSSRNGKATEYQEGKSSSWSKLKDPRIVRVSRVLGGKDRHSKVHTVKGLRDRRVRLSVPTAIQLYDLQDRMGLNQPSKVFDWLMDAAKHEIDELPPLQMPPFDHNSHFQNHHFMPSSSQNQLSRNKDLFLNTDWKNEKEHGHYPASEPTTNNSYYQWEASNFLLSHLGGNEDQVSQKTIRNELPPHTHDLHNFMQNGSQLMVSPPVLSQTYFPTGLAQFSVAQPFNFPSQNENVIREDSY